MPTLRPFFTAPLCTELEDTPVGNPRREGFPRARYSGHGSIYGGASTGRTITVFVLSRGRALGTEAAEWCIMASRVF